jgi:hypothetical protein
MVVFRGNVVEVYRAKSGTYLLKFERGTTKNVFKVVITPPYVRNFERSGVHIKNYRGQTIQVRGLVQNHPMWNYEIVVTDPTAISSVTLDEYPVA